LGSKNRIFLGIISNLMLHFLRNAFSQKALYITKFKLKKIRQKHPNEAKYLLDGNFQNIIKMTVALCDYEEDNLHNFVAKVEERYIIYSISNRGFYNHIGTLFFTSKRQLKKCQKSMIFFNDEFEKEFLEYLKG